MGARGAAAAGSMMARCGGFWMVKTGRLQLALLLSVLAKRPAAGHQVVQLALLLSALARRPAAMKRAAGRLQPVQTNRFRAIVPGKAGPR